MSSDSVFILVPRSTLDASDQRDDVIKTPRGLLFEMSVSFTRPISIKVAYNADADGAKVIDPEHVALMEAVIEADLEHDAAEAQYNLDREAIAWRQRFGKALRARYSALDALTAYRKECGLCM